MPVKRYAASFWRFRAVAERLGHADPAVTLRVYSQVTPMMHREAAQVMDGCYLGQRDPTVLRY